MGRHSSGRTGPFIRSLVGWLLPWLLIATVVVVGAWMAVDYSRRGAASEPVAQTDSEVDEEPAEETRETRSSSPTQEASESPSPTEEPKEKRVPLITQGVTVQVLNGTNDPEGGNKMAVRLEKLRFQVVAVEFTSTPYKETTVLWSFPEAQKAAEALAARFDWVAKEKPANLADTVSLHVVVGRDEV